MRTFSLYPEERHWWSFADYGAVLDVVTRLEAKRIVEFGPGSSTLALIEGGATHIDTFEDRQDWYETYRERLAAVYPEIVHLHRYTWSDPLALEAASQDRYDLALIDGPHGTLQRPAVIRWCVDHAAAVLVPTEEIAYGHSALRPHLEAIAADHGLTLEYMETGPLSGGFALLTRAPAAAVEVIVDVEGQQPTAPMTMAQLGQQLDASGKRASRRQRRKAAKATAKATTKEPGA